MHKRPGAAGVRRAQSMVLSKGLTAKIRVWDAAPLLSPLALNRDEGQSGGGMVVAGSPRPESAPVNRAKGIG